MAQYVDAYQEARDARGRRLVVRHGQAEAQKVTCGAGTVKVRAPRVNDKRVDATGQRERFTIRILPPYMRRSPQVAEVLPILSLRRCTGVRRFQPRYRYPDVARWVATLGLGKSP